jgi:hypothetical protein
MWNSQSKWAFCILIVLLLSNGYCQGSDQKVDTLMVGKGAGNLPMGWSSEPLVDFTNVPMGDYFVYSIEEARRMVRLYFPRTDEAMAEFEFLWLNAVYVESLTLSQIESLRSAIVEGGSGSFTGGGGLTKNWGEGVNRAWVDSTLADVFPNDPDASDLWERFKNSLGPLGYQVVVNKNPALPPVISMFLPLGIEELRSSYLVLMKPQQGAITWAWARGAYPGVLGEDPPLLLSWEYGEGMTWTIAQVGGPEGLWREQIYGLDMFVNIILHSLGRPLPEDIMLVNTVRRRFQRVADRVSSLYSYMDFVERFGASSSRLIAEQRVVEEIVVGAENLYLNGLYQDSLSELERGEEIVQDLEKMAVKWKDQALLWIYAIEWALVTGTLTLAGSFTYMVMLRRRLYRRAGLTTFRQE